MSSHAYLSASGASKWLNCTASRKLESKYEERTSSYAAEGTLAHELAEVQLAYELGVLKARPYKARLKAIKADPLYTDDMPRHVQTYVDYVRAEFTAAQAINEDATILLEERLDFSEYVPKGYGTGDTTIGTDSVLNIIDLKYGKGVKVSAVDNSQLKLYGLGGLEAFDLLYSDIETVVLTIVQPRLDHISVFRISKTDLIEWAENTVRPAAALAIKGEGELSAGDWCRWCKAKARCTAYAELATIAARNDFADPKELTDEELVEALNDMAKIRDWLKAVEEYTLKEALHGKSWDGYKIVNSRGRRVWTDKDKVIAKLKALKFARAKFIDTKLKGITAIEQIMSVDKFETNLKPLIVKAEGSKILVPESDKRIASGTEQARIDFPDDNDDTDLL